MTAPAPTELLKLADKYKRWLDTRDCPSGLRHEFELIEAALRQAASVERAEPDKPDYEAAAIALGFQKMPSGKWWAPDPLWHPSYLGRWDSAEAIFASWDRCATVERAEVAGEAVAWSITNKQGGRRAGHYGYAVEIVDTDGSVIARLPGPDAKSKAKLIVDAVNASAAPASPPRSEGVRASEVPVCCYCDAALSCSVCGREQRK